MIGMQAGSERTTRPGARGAGGVACSCETPSNKACASLPVAGSLAIGGNVMAQKIRKGAVVSAIVLLCGLATFVLPGCATTRGFGQDVQSLGRGIEKSAK